MARSTLHVSLGRWLIAGISSDMYFGRGHHDPNASAEAQGRLQQFSGATAISSNAYFGREEEDEEERGAGGAGGAGGDYGDSETIQQLERGIRDMAGRVMGSQEVQNLTEQVRAGALKVSRGSIRFAPIRIGVDWERRLGMGGISCCLRDISAGVRRGQREAMTGTRHCRLRPPHVD